MSAFYRNIVFRKLRKECDRLIMKNSFSTKVRIDVPLKEEVKNFELPKPELDISYLCLPKNKESIKINIKRRKGVGDIDRVQNLHQQLENAIPHEKKALEKEFLEEAVKIPNKSHPDIVCYGDNPKIVNEINKKKLFTFKPKEFSNLAKNLNVIRTNNLGNFTGQRSYYLMGDLAELEEALIQYAIHNLQQKGFTFMSVPDILPRQIIESCGMNTRGERTQVYELNPDRHIPDMILSGTSEMALAGYLMNRVFTSDELPLKLAAVSRCYRAEVSSIAEEKGIYRVHQFTKVEMFSITTPDSSEEVLKEFCNIQEESFGALDLHLQTVDMPLPELGSPAYRKYDVEAWLPGRGIYGEVSSCSNCTDYQSRRLNIKYHLPNSDRLVHVHTINGTACAIPRMLIALFETHQKSDGTVHVPEVLQPFMNGKKIIVRNTKIPKYMLMKTKIPEKKSGE